MAAAEAGLDFLEAFDSVTDLGQVLGPEQIRSILSDEELLNEEFLKQLEPFPDGSSSAWTCEESLDSGASTASSGEFSPGLHSPSSSTDHSPPPSLNGDHFHQVHQPRNVVLVIPPGAPISLTASAKAPHGNLQPSHYPLIAPRQPGPPSPPRPPLLLSSIALPPPQQGEVKMECGMGMGVGVGVGPPSVPPSPAPTPTPTPSLAPTPTPPVQASTPAPFAHPDDFAAKREQRKIRNREAAQLSRQRRKEAVEDLTRRLAEAESETEALRKENAELRSRLASLGALHFEEPRRKMGRFTTQKAALVSLMAIFGLVTFSMAPLTSFTPIASPSSLSASRKAMSMGGGDGGGGGGGGLEPLEHFHSRSLMSLDSSRGGELRERIARVERSLRQSAAAAATANATRDDCARRFVNQTESRRLADELSLWMEMHAELTGGKSGRGWRKAKSSTPLHSTPERRRRERRREEAVKSLEIPGIDYVAHRSLPTATATGASSPGDLALFSSPQLRYIQRLREALRKRDDTFYLVSFRKDYLLLPATATNSSRLPRMSLVVPINQGQNGNSSSGGQGDDVRMMQIDCDVTATGLLHLPSELRQQQTRPAASASPTSTP